MSRGSNSPSSVDDDMSDDEDGVDDDGEDEEEDVDDGNSLNKTVKKGGGSSTTDIRKYVLIFALVKNSDVCPIHISLSSPISFKVSCYYSHTQTFVTAPDTIPCD